MGHGPALLSTEANDRCGWIPAVRGARGTDRPSRAVIGRPLLIVPIDNLWRPVSITV